MVDAKEKDMIAKRFRRYIEEKKISRPKHNKEPFFKKKAASSLQLARTLFEQSEHFDWVINIAYYSMFYNATSLLASRNIDLKEIDESIHALTYQATIFFFHIQHPIIEEHYLEDFKISMEQSDTRLMNLARRKSEEIIASYRNAKDERGKITYELGRIAEQKSAATALRRAEAFDILCEKLLFRG